jgi:hypothetical protein
MPQAGFELTIPVFEQAKTVHAFERAVTVIGTIRTTKYFYINKVALDDYSLL